MPANRRFPSRITTRTSGTRLRIIVTAGPTREPLDPVRFLSNYSTGVMGYEIAREAARRGHRVVLISGPTALTPPDNVAYIPVESARHMEQAICRRFRPADAVIMAAAVCDWRPTTARHKKIKRPGSPRPRSDKKNITLTLTENTDILYRLGRKKGRKLLVGFALETESLFANALRKLKEKNLDLIVANRLDPSARPPAMTGGSLGMSPSGVRDGVPPMGGGLHRTRSCFGHGATDVVIIGRGGKPERLSGAPKRSVAKAIIDKVESMCYSSTTMGRGGRAKR